MLKLNKYEGKTEEQALEKCMETTKLKREDFIYKVEHIEGKLFKSDKYIISILSKEDIVNYIKEFFTEVGKLSNIEITTEVEIEEDYFNINLVSSNNSILIGKDGKTLTALQTVLRQIFRNQIGLPAKINLDISNYRLDKLKKVDREIERIIKEVISTKMDIYLDPMNAYERRYIHNLVNSHNYVKTESVGEGTERRVVIKYDENKEM